MTTETPADDVQPEVANVAKPRSRSRESMMLLATLRLPDGERKARVRNLSPGGMMVDLDTSLSAGTRVDVELPRIGDVVAQVAWSRDGRTGFSFETEVDIAKARRQIGGGEGSPVYSKSLTVGPRALRVR